MLDDRSNHCVLVVKMSFESENQISSACELTDSDGSDGDFSSTDSRNDPTYECRSDSISGSTDDEIDVSN